VKTHNLLTTIAAMFGCVAVSVAVQRLIVSSFIRKGRPPELRA
jgi:hypothetical protein